MRHDTATILTGAIAFLLTPLAHSEAPPVPTAPWQTGKAEITTYDLEQARYGAVHEGVAVLIFVAEPFSASKQIKLDNWQNAGSDRVDVVKLNFTKSFLTGVYPYSMMLSVFTPLDTHAHPRTLKTTCSVQEWCGQAFNQLNLRDGAYEARQFSYFESEGDKRAELPVAWLEDELWTKIRLSPSLLPEGEFQIIPGSFYSRLLHVPQRPIKAAGSWMLEERAERTYVFEHLEGPSRTLRITVEANWPHAITAWRETFKDLGGNEATTRATRRKSILLDYWRHNNVGDRALREQLGLPTGAP